MLSNDFLESKHSYRVCTSDMADFLKECEEEELRWSHGLKPTEFNPIKFYEGENVKYLVPIQRVDDRSRIYVKCFYGKLYFKFCYDWSVQPGVDYKAK